MILSFTLQDKCEHCPVIDDLPCIGLINEGICLRVLKGEEDFIQSVINQSKVGFFDKIKNIFGAANDFLRNRAPVVGKKVKKERLDICLACEFHQPDPEFNTEEGKCGFCGCYLKAKAAMATESCPLPSPKWVATISPQQNLNTEQKIGGCCNGQ